MSVAALVDAYRYSSPDAFSVSARAIAIAGVDHFHSAIEVLASTSQALAELEPMDDDPDHLCQLFCVEEDQGQEDDPAECDPLYVDSSDIEQADDAENAVDNAVRLYKLFEFGQDKPPVAKHDPRLVHQSEIDQADEVEDGERLGQLESPEARRWWATPTMEELSFRSFTRESPPTPVLVFTECFVI